MDRFRLASELLKLARSLTSRDVKLDEKDDLMREMKRLIGTGDYAVFDYRKTDGSASKRKVQPTMILKMKGRPAMKAIDTKDGIEKFFYLDMIGEGTQDVQKVERPRRLTAAEMLKELQERIPKVRMAWKSMRDTSPTKVKMLWEALNGERGLRRHLILSDEQGIGQGPYGSMERTQIVGLKTYIDVLPGKSWNMGRVRITEKEYSYWTDDEGHRW